MARFSAVKWLHMGHTGIFGLAAFLLATFFFFLMITFKDYIHLLPFPHVLFVFSLVCLLALICIRLFLYGGRGQRSRPRNLCVLVGLCAYALAVGFFIAALTEVAIYGTYVAISGRALSPPLMAERMAKSSVSRPEPATGGTNVYVRYGNQKPRKVTITDSQGNFRFFVTRDERNQVNTVFVEYDEMREWCPDTNVVGTMSFVAPYINFANITPELFYNLSDEANEIVLPKLYVLKHQGCRI